MISIQKVIFPGIAAGCLFLVFVVSLIANPTVALAAGSGVRFQEAVDNAHKQPAAAEKKPSAEQAEPAQVKAKQAQSKSVGGACSLGQTYPDSVQQWCGLIEQYAGNNNLDPNLLAAVMLQESGGNPQAYSKSGAVGLLQVMPRDGLASSFMCINGPCFSSRPSSQELYDPEFNISYGANMLAGLIQKHGDVREALRAYGPMNMGYRYADIILNIMDRYR
jgi:soluble lytic murein transglycosylase-like protein